MFPLFFFTTSFFRTFTSSNSFLPFTFFFPMTAIADNEHYYYVHDKPPRSATPYPYPPPIMVKHAIWFFPDADLFITIRSILYGVHRSRLLHQSSFFLNIPVEIKPCRTAQRGSTPSLPIAFNHLDSSLFTALLHLNNPHNFRANEFGWHRLKALAREWGFYVLVDRAIDESSLLARLRRPYLHSYLHSRTRS